MMAMMPATPAHQSSSASTWKAPPLVCLEFENSVFSVLNPDCLFHHRLPFPASMALLRARNSSHFQAPTLLRALKFHTLTIVRGI